MQCSATKTLNAHSVQHKKSKNEYKHSDRKKPCKPDNNSENTTGMEKTGIDCQNLCKIRLENTENNNRIVRQCHKWFYKGAHFSLFSFPF